MSGERAASDFGSPIERGTLHEAVATRLRDMIIEGALPAGGRINETELCRAIGVSRTPLREAIKTLASEGLIELTPSRGGAVRRFTVQDVAHVLEALKMVEQTAARLGCARGPDAGVAAILALHDRMMDEYRARRRLAYFKLNQSIHSAIVALAGNPALTETHDRLQARLKRIRYVGNEAPARWADAVAEHETMAETLARRDGEALAVVLGEHMDRTLERVRDVL